MTFPVNEQEFCERWLSALADPDEGDRELAIATIQAINRAYYAGLEDGGGKLQQDVDEFNRTGSYGDSRGGKDAGRL